MRTPTIDDVRETECPICQYKHAYRHLIKHAQIIMCPECDHNEFIPYSEAEETELLEQLHLEFIERQSR